MSTKSPGMPTVLALEARLFMADIVPALEQAGFAAVQVPSKDLDVAKFDALCDAHQPAFVLTVNFAPEIAFLCSRKSLPYVSWTVDPLPASRWEILPDTDLSRCVAFLHDRVVVGRARAQGLEAHYLPLAASPRRTPAPDSSAVAERPIPVSFVGNSLASEESLLWDLVRGAGASGVVQERLETWLGAEETAFDTAFDGTSASLPVWLRDVVEPSTAAALADAAAGALSHRLRLRCVRACLPHGAEVWGDSGWEVLGKVFRGAADHGDELTDIYRKSAVSLDIPRVYQREIVTMRVFDVLACGGVVLCAASGELARLFDVGRHLLTYRDSSDLVETVRTLLVDGTLRKNLAARGRAHVEANHRVFHRVAEMLEEVRKMVPSVRVGSA